jgi:hypothetical protein
MFHHVPKCSIVRMAMKNKKQRKKTVSGTFYFSYMAEIYAGKYEIFRKTMLFTAN